MTTVGVLALQGDVAEHLASLRRLGVEAIAVKRAEQLTALDGLVIPGGESTAIGKLARRWELLEPLRDWVADSRPIYGTCAGMILLADDVVDQGVDQPLIGGLPITVRRNAFGRQVDSFEADVELAGFDDPFPAVFIRAPVVEAIADSVEVVGSVARPDGTVRIVAVRAGNILATSFHPELTGDDRVHATFVDMVEAAR